MATNAAPLDIRVWIYPGADPATDSTYWGLAEDISAYLRYPGGDGGQAIEYSWGRGDEAGQVDASSIAMTLDNRDGRFSTANVLGPYYGYLTRNTPIVVGTRSGYDTFARTGATIGTSTGGQAYSATSLIWSTNGTSLLASGLAANAIALAAMATTASRDFDLTFKVKSNQVSTGASYVASAQQRIDNSNYLLFSVVFGLAGALSVQFQRVGTDGGSLVFGTVVLGYTYAASTQYSVRVQRTGQQVRMKVWATAGAEPSAWTTSGTEAYLAPANLGLHVWRVVGNTNVGQILTFNDLEIISLEAIATVVQWPIRWNKAATNSWAPIQCAGILRRLQQGSGPLKSPLTRQMTSYGPTGYWPLEDESGATFFGSAVEGVNGATMRDVTPAGDSTLAGGGSAPTLSATNGTIQAYTPYRVAGSATGFAALILAKFPNGLPATSTSVVAWQSVGPAARWTFSMTATAWAMTATAADGTVLGTDSANFLADMDAAEWMAWQLETEVVGANTVWSFIGHQVGLGTYYAITGSFAGTTVSSASHVIIGSSNLPQGTAFAHAWLGENGLPFVNDSFSLVSSGYAGELASDRIQRLCDEEGIPVQVEPGESSPLGAQPRGNILSVLRAAADADIGILYEVGTGLGYRPRSARYNLSTWQTLTVAAGEIDAPPEPIDDDQRYRNRWTVSRDGGAFALAEDVGEIETNGLYEDSASVNAYSDDTLTDHAAWLLGTTKRQGFRWPRLSLNLVRSTSLISAWRQRPYFPRLAVTTGLDQVAGADPDVILEGYSATLYPHGWAVVMNCSNAAAWDVGLWDTARWDNPDSILVGDYASGATALTVTTDTIEWSSTVPYDILISGERMTVTAVGAATSTQVLTVTRSVNGVVKAQADAAEVHVFVSGRYGY